MSDPELIDPESHGAANPMRAMGVAVTRVLTVRHRYLGAVALWLFGALSALAFFASVGSGPLDIAPVAMLAIVADALGVPWQFTATEQSELMSVRLPRTFLGVMSGAALAASGAALQGLLRNPLADPALMGVSAGAALAVAGATVLGAGVSTPPSFDALVLPLAAFAGGLFATWLVYRIASREGRTNVAAMLLAGVVVNVVAFAGIGLLVFAGSGPQFRDPRFWLLGSLGGVTGTRLLAVTPLLVGALVALPHLARHLDALLMGEREALYPGFRVKSAKRRIAALAALAAGTSVVLTGVIGFIGLVVPHLVRVMIGPDHRMLLPAVILLGAGSMLMADLAARMVVLPADLPIGVLTACVGGPLLLWLLVRRRFTGGG